MTLPTDEERAAVAQSLVRMGLAAEDITLTRLSGGVSCDVWKVDAKARRPW